MTISFKSFVDDTICINSNIDISIVSTRRVGFPVCFLSFPLFFASGKCKAEIEPKIVLERTSICVEIAAAKK